MVRHSPHNSRLSAIRNGGDVFARRTTRRGLQIHHSKRQTLKTIFTRGDEKVVGGAALCGALGLLAWLIHCAYFGGGSVELELVEPVSFSYELDLNEATWPELAQLPGIGPVLAKRIVAYREEATDFQRLDDLQLVRGIGPRTLSRLTPYISQRMSRTAKDDS